MAHELTGIERQLVLEYLMDGNVPVTVTPAESHAADNSTGEPVSAGRIFPVALRAEQLTVLDQGIILLKDAPESVRNFDGQQVRVQFYFNKLGLYFVTTMRRTRTGLALVIPAVIKRVQDEKTTAQSGISAVLYYETGAPHTGVVNITCGFDDSYPLFTEPRWSDVDEREQKAAKTYLEQAVAASRPAGGNGLFLIPVCRYLAHEHDAATVRTNADRAEPPTLLYLNHERIVFGCHSGGYRLLTGSEYALKLEIPLPTPVRVRTVYITCRAETVQESDDKRRSCVICRHTSIKEEDVRFLYDLSVRPPRPS